jgi:transposase
MRGCPPSQTPKPHLSSGPRTGIRREASVGRAGGGRPLHPEPDHVIMAQAKTGPQGGGAVQAQEPHLQAVDDTIEWPPSTPLVPPVEPHAGPCAPWGQSYVAPVPVGMAPGTPFGASIQRLATDLRSMQASSDARLSARLAQGERGPIRAGARANLCRRVHRRLDHRVEESLTRRRSRRLICRDETGARVHGCTPWAWVFQPTEVGGHGIRPSRSPRGSQEVLGDQRPTVWVSDRSRAQRHHPAAPWHSCWAHQ